MTIEIDSEESMDAFAHFGVVGRSIALRFDGCWRILSLFLGYQSNPEQIFDWTAFGDSELLRQLHASLGVPTRSLLHHKFEFSGGSSLEVVSESGVVEGCTGLS